MTPPRISVVTAIHNDRAVNEIFWETLCQNTLAPFELIVVDNFSTDGSEEFFQDLVLSPQPAGRRLRYLRNGKLQSESASRLQGMAHASADVWIFLKNDSWVPPGWHLPLERELARDPFLIVSPSSPDAQPTRAQGDRLRARWKKFLRLSRLWQGVTFASEKKRLYRALRWMYGDLDRFESPTPVRESEQIAGIAESCVAFHRQLLEKLPHPWDPKIQEANRHLYLTLANLHELDPAVPLPQILLDTYVHSFGRRENIPAEVSGIPVEKFWGEAAVRRLWWGFQLPEG